VSTFRSPLPAHVDARRGAPVMNDPWGELSRLSFDETCRTSR